MSAEATGEDPRARWRTLPERVDMSMLVTEVSDKSVPDSITYADDPEREWLVRYGLAGG